MNLQYNNEIPVKVNGLLCKKLDRKILVLKNRNYKGYIIFRIRIRNLVDISVQMEAVSVNMLSYEEAGKDAINLLFSNISK